MKKISELIKGVKVCAGDVGIEIEMVGRNLPSPSSLVEKAPSWRLDDDGSLRGFETGEFVLRKPVVVEGVGGVLKELTNCFEYCDTEIHPSITAGTHVHINVQNLNIKQIMTLTCCYFIVEELLVDWCHPSRKGNHFCLRAKDAEFLISLILETLEKGKLGILNTDDIRYSGINFCSLFKYGSLEFRSLEGTNDFKRLETWCKILHTLKESSMKFSEPKEVFDYLINNDYEKFLSYLLGKYAQSLKSEDWQKKMYNGVLLGQDIAYAKDWSVKNLNIFLQNKESF
jgi:hypothetical protein